MKFPTLRLASKEEVEKVQAHADLTAASSVVALDTEKGPILGVIRHITEVDPVFFPEGCPDQKKYQFLWGLVSSLRLMNTVPEIYFNLPADDARWRALLERAGAQNTSETPEFRFKMSLAYEFEKDRTNTE